MTAPPSDFRPLPASSGQVFPWLATTVPFQSLCLPMASFLSVPVLIFPRSLRTEHMTKCTLERRGFAWLALVCHGPLREARAEREADAMNGFCLLACSSWLAQSALLHNPVPPALWWHHPVHWDCPQQSLIKKTLHSVAYRPNLMGAFSQ